MGGIDLDQPVSRVAEIYKIEVNDIVLKGKQQKRVKARSLFCYWAGHELGISPTELARQAFRVKCCGRGILAEERLNHRQRKQLSVNNLKI